MRQVRKTLTGAYVMETTHTELSASGIWSLYTTLTRVEGGLPCPQERSGSAAGLSSDRRPNTSTSVCFCPGLSSALSHREPLPKTGDTRSWRTLRETLETYTRVTVSGSDPHTGYHYEIRDFVEPEASHKEIFRILEASSHAAATSVDSSRRSFKCSTKFHQADFARLGFASIFF